MMKLSLSTPALFILHTLQTAGFEAYIVGGAVRDLLLHSDTQSLSDHSFDYDFTTNATPDTIQELFPDSFYENRFGTVSITPQHLAEQMQLPSELLFPVQESESTEDRLIDISSATKIHVSLLETLPNNSENSEEPTTLTPIPNYEITTFRTDGTYENGRHPTTVNWGSTLQEDLERRDFTINALALSISSQVLADIFSSTSQNEIKRSHAIFEGDYTIHDISDGVSHLNQKLLTTVGNPETRFQEDALRMLRAVRFSVQLNFQISDTTFSALVHNASLLEHISQERIRDELFKILKSSYPAEGIELLDSAGMLAYVLPELLEAKGVEQGGHHTTDVWTHSLDALRECPSADPLVRFATLLHDIGKPATCARTTAGDITFYNHEIVGSRIASSIARRLKLSKQQRERLFILVRHHMFHYQPHDTDAAIRRFMRKVGLENLDDMLDLREADRLGSGARKTSWRLEEMKQRMTEQLHQPMTVTDLAISGNDLITELKMQPGPKIGEILQSLFEHVTEDDNLNTKEKLLELARQKLS